MNTKNLLNSIDRLNRQNRHNTEESYNAYLAAFRALHPCDQSDLRGCAYFELKCRGCHEIGSSDVSDQVLYDWFRHYGSFSYEVIKELKRYYL